jgi:DNA-directed RNA polymerase specialized sigma24 family protein
MEQNVKSQISMMPGHGSTGTGVADVRTSRHNRRQAKSPVNLMKGGRPALSTERQTEPPRRVVSKWQLDNASLAALLKALGPDADQAGRKYAKLRERLARFFEWNRVDNADELADETLDRLARRLRSAEGAGADGDANGNSREKTIERPEEFAAGIARLVLFEQRRRQMRAEQALQNVQRECATEQAASRAEDARRTEDLAAVLDSCMDELPVTQRELIARYYNVNGRSTIDARKWLAREMGISINALRNRALRIRAELENQMRSRLQNRG